ncbi:MAG: adenosylmethionine decarboxylase [Spirochaetia bacterium]|nr:adenosylmethionine decarboxylase [Spirochaetia bacterium]
MVRRVKGQKIKLDGFNNLTKSLSFNIYDICYARSKESQLEYLEYVDEEYDSTRLETIVEEVTRIINAKLVQVSTQDYDPRGASVVALVNEDHPLIGTAPFTAPHSIPADLVPAGHSLPEGLTTDPSSTLSEILAMSSPAVVGHLDKSHIAIHTYPEYNVQSGIATFRVDIDIATCGMISPLSALHYLIESFESEVVIIDYRVRGFTRDGRGTKYFIDHDISSIQDYISEDALEDYTAYDINIVSDNNFHTKMRKKEIKLKDFLFGDEVTNLLPKDKKRIKQLIDLEVQELFESKNLGRRMGLS